MALTDFADYATKPIIRQGDVTFFPVGGLDYLEKQYPQTTSQNKYDVWRQPRIEDVADGIIQRGESTGHDHRLQNDDPTGRRGFLKRVGQSLFVVAAGVAGARVVQATTNPNEVEGKDLHLPVDLEPDTTYAVRIAREFDYASERDVYVRD